MVTTIADYVGSRDLTVTGTVTAGAIDFGCESALDFGGLTAGNYGKTANPPEGGEDGWTACGWVYPSTESSNYPIMESGGSGTHSLISVRQTAGAFTDFQFEFSTDGLGYDVTLNHTAGAFDTWNFLTFGYDGADWFARVLTQNSLWEVVTTETSTGSYGGLVTGPSSFWMGADSSETANFLSGYLANWVWYENEHLGDTYQQVYYNQGSGICRWNR